jgi:predicted metal-dependent HD superfamily phosphohydrolase
MLQQTYTALCLQYTSDTELVAQCWHKLHKCYNSKRRYYHNLRHIEAVLQLVQATKDQWHNYPAAVLASYYHDAVYNVLKKDNELKSADMALAHLMKMGLPQADCSQCAALILATQHHTHSTDTDCNLFTDADLSILGSPPDSYQRYAEAIRREYALYPDLLYKPGRCKVLQHFLGMARIFKTAFFYERYEAQARANLTAELARY